LLSWMAGSAPAIPSLDGKPFLVPSPSPKPRHSALPILVVLFVISYSLMTLLVFEQARTIESQRGLIHSLFQDSSQLNRLKIEAIQAQQRAAAQAQAEAAQHAQGKTPSTQEKKQDLGKAGPNAGKRKQVLPNTPDIEDSSFERAHRFVITI
jgi:hypothetical protein